MDFEMLLPKTLKKYREEETYLDVIKESFASDWSPLTQAVFMFKELYWNNSWTMRLGEDTYHLLINDIIFIWDHLPELLTQCISSDERLYFDLDEVKTTFAVKSETGGKLEVDYYIYEDSGYKTSKFKHYVIDRQVFITEWRRFIDAIVRLVVQHGFVDANDPSIAEYLSGLPV